MNQPASDPRLYPDRPFMAASVAVFRDGKVLLASRTAPPAESLYSLPGGVVEAGELLAEAALRELFEEVAVKASIIGFVDHSEVVQRDAEGRVKRHFIIACFAATWLDGEGTTGPEAGHILWADPDQLGGIAMTKGLGPILKKAKAIALAGQTLR
jgi:8-oxo-dGTP diphosphatase